MAQILVLGAGKIGSLAAGLLSGIGGYDVHLADLTLDAPKRVVDNLGFPPSPLANSTFETPRP